MQGDGAGNGVSDVGAGQKAGLSPIMAVLDRYPFLVLGLLLVGAFASSSAAPLAGLYVVEGLGQAPGSLALLRLFRCV